MRLATVVLLCTLVSTTMFGGDGTLFVRKLSVKPDGTRSANIVSFDREGKIRPFTEDDLELFEGGDEVKIISVECPEPLPPVHVSSVLTIDVSGSMVRGRPSNLTLAVEAANAWIDALSDTSECAITTFDHTGSVLTDFTTDKERLKQNIAKLQPEGGTSFQEGLLSAASGGVSLVRGGRNRRVVVFLTDGNGRVSSSKVIAAANANNATVYCVSLGLRMPTVLKTIAEQTGGLWFESVTTVDEAVMAYRRIYADATGAGGCEVVWQGALNCSGRLDILARLGDGEWKKRLAIPADQKTSVTVSPKSVIFGAETAGFQKLMITAATTPITITDVQLDRTDVFSISEVDVPLTLDAGERVELEVTRLVVDSSYVVGKLELQTEPCPIDPIYFSAGDPKKAPQQPTLRVVHPNGGERFATNSRVSLDWEGLPPEEPVHVEVSTNGGYSWRTITKAGRNNTALWKASRVPSDSCLLRVTHLNERSGNIEPILRIEGRGYFEAAVSPDGTKVVGSEMTGRPGSRATRPRVVLYDAVTGDSIKELGPGEKLLFSKDGSVLLTWDQHDIRAYDMNTLEQLWIIDPQRGILNCDISNDGSVALVAGQALDTTRVVDGRTGELISIIPRASQNIQWADLSADGSRVATSDIDSSASVFDASTGDRLMTISEPNGRRFYRVVLSPTNNVLATTGSHGTAALWDAETGDLMKEVSKRRYVNDNTYLAFSDDGSKLAVEAGTDQTRIVEVETGEPLVSMRRRSDVGGATSAGFFSDGATMFVNVLTKISLFDSESGVQIGEIRRGGGVATVTEDGKHVVAIDTGRSIAVYNLESPLLQQDVSDAFWALYSASGELKEIDFGERQVGQFTDSLVVGYIKNTSASDTLHATQVSLQGSGASDFSHSIPDEFAIGPGDSLAFDFTFHPQKQGLRQANIVISSDAGRLAGRLFGKGLSSVIAAGSGDFDLGTFPVGEAVTGTIDSMIVNSGDEVITVESVKPVGPNSDLFDVMGFDPFEVQPGKTQGLHVIFLPRFPGKVSTKVEIKIREIDEPIYATIRGAGERDSVPPQDTAQTVEEPIDTVVADQAPGLKDPTTFRSILLPTAVVPEAGTVTTGIYDIVGFTAGYSITDNIQVMGGGVIPIPNRWFGATGYDASVGGAWFLGAKTGFEVDTNWVVGGGLAVGQSYYDQDTTEALESKISFQSVWGMAGYGDDDSRLNALFGYAFKDHQTFLDGNFRADGFMYGLAYDYRIADNWKICGEGFFIRSMDFVPITITARYFRETDAFEFGFTYIGIQASGAPPADFPIVPMISWVKRW